MSTQSIAQAVISAVSTKSLQDVVKGVRTHKRDPKPYISRVIAECKSELSESDPFVKAQAIRKLTYLQMMGYDMSWASFYVVEVMSQPRFAHKRIGYLAACQSFQRDTEVVLLTTNLLKKEFGSMNQYDVGQAINCMANIANKDLARDLLADAVNLMSNSKPYVRKKSVLAMYKLFVAYPQGLRLSFDKLKDKLNDEEASVVSCAVNGRCRTKYWQAGGQAGRRSGRQAGRQAGGRDQQLYYSLAALRPLTNLICPRECSNTTRAHRDDCFSSFPLLSLFRGVRAHGMILWTWIDRSVHVWPFSPSHPPKHTFADNTK